MACLCGLQKIMTFKKSLIKKALLKQNRNLDAVAVQAFKSTLCTVARAIACGVAPSLTSIAVASLLSDVMSYMGDRKSSKPPMEHATKVLCSRRYISFQWC